MTPQEKAKELVNKFRDFADGIDSETDRFSPNIERKNAKQCARIAVNELMELAKKYETKNCKLLMDNLKILYWQEVKKEIEKL
jgi:hypothetical protein